MFILTEAQKSRPTRLCYLILITEKQFHAHRKHRNFLFRTVIVSSRYDIYKWNHLYWSAIWIVWCYRCGLNDKCVRTWRVIGDYCFWSHLARCATIHATHFPLSTHPAASGSDKLALARCDHAVVYLTLETSVAQMRERVLMSHERKFQTQVWCWRHDASSALLT